MEPQARAARLGLCKTQPLIHHTSSDSETCQLWQMGSSLLTWANQLSAVGVLTNLLRLDRFKGTACLFHV